MLDNTKKLKDEIKELRRENQKYRDTIQYYNSLVKAVEEKEKRYDEMLTYLEAQKIELRQALDITKNLQRQLKEEMKKIK